VSFLVQVEWTQQGFAQRQQKAQAVAVPDRGSYGISLTDTIRAWAMMTLASVNPGPRSQGFGGVSYSSVTPPTPKQLQTWWGCDVSNWSANGVTLRVTDIQ
jgi:hypothetical protein